MSEMHVERDQRAKDEKGGGCTDSKEAQIQNNRVRIWKQKDTIN